MKLTRIRILNYMGITSLQINEVGRINKIMGDNGKGKSSVLKAIIEAFVPSGTDPDVIHVGKNKAEIAVEIDGSILVEREITPTQNTVKVTVNGNKLSSPQTVLKKMLGAYNFNPVDFFLAKARERRNILLSAMPIRIDKEALGEALGDFSSAVDLSDYNFDDHALSLLEQLQGKTYNARHLIGQEVTRLQKSIEQDKAELPAHIVKPDESTIGELTAAYTAARESIQENERDKQRILDWATENAKLKAAIKELKEKAESIERGRKKIAEQYPVLVDKVNGFIAPDVGTLKAKIDDYEGQQRLKMRHEDILRRETELETVEQKHDALDACHKFLTVKLPKQILSRASLPVEGLTIQGDTIKLNNIAIDKLSHSEQIRFGLDIARALSGDLKVICVDNFEALSVKNQAAFEAETKGDGFEYFVTLVSDEALAHTTVQ